MADPNRKLFERVIHQLGPLLNELTFVGGCATGLLVTDAAASSIRPTNDVDAIVDVKSYAAYTGMADRLRALGWAEDTREGAPLCRWRHRDLIVDIMPTDSRVLGFSNSWYVEGIRTAHTRSIAGRQVRLVSSVYFVATKLEAFEDRGRDDLAMSHDLEDLVAVIDGRPEIVQEVESADGHVRGFIASEFSRLLADKVFIDSLSGFLNPDPASQARRALLETRLRAIARVRGVS